MESEDKKFGRGPRELTGAVDLISHYKLLPHHEFFCKKSLPLSISDTHYLHNVVGDTEIRKGEGMQLNQLIQNTSYPRETNARIQPFDQDILIEAFQLRETGPVDLPPAEKGVPTIPGKSKSESKDKDRKHKKHKDRDKEKDREHKKHKHRHKDRSKDKDKDKKKDKSAHQESGADHSKKHHEKKRKHDGEDDINDIHRHKKSKHKTSKIEEMGGDKGSGLTLWNNLGHLFPRMVVERLVEFSLNVVKKYLRVASDEGEFTSFRICGSKCKKKKGWK